VNGVALERWEQDDDGWFYRPIPSEEEQRRRDEEWSQWIAEERVRQYGRPEQDFYDPTWGDKEAEERLACWVKDNIPPLRVYYDEEEKEFKCRCARFASYGKCSHIWRYRDENTITFADDWKDCF
jgi:hypothetical protein